MTCLTPGWRDPGQPAAGPVAQLQQRGSRGSQRGRSGCSCRCTLYRCTGGGRPSGLDVRGQAVRHAHLADVSHGGGSHGNMAIWPHGHMATWSHGHMAIWPHSHIITWSHGNGHMQVAGVDRAVVTDGFYANTELSPQVNSSTYPQGPLNVTLRLGIEGCII